MSNRLNRREMLRNASLAGVGILVSRGAVGAESTSPNETLNLSFVGSGGRGAANLGVLIRDKSVNVVALCDVDQQRAAPTFERFPKARKFQDFRKMLEEGTELSLPGRDQEQCEQPAEFGVAEHGHVSFFAWGKSGGRWLSIGEGRPGYRSLVLTGVLNFLFSRLLTRLSPARGEGAWRSYFSAIPKPTRVLSRLWGTTEADWRGFTGCIEHAFSL